EDEEEKDEGEVQLLLAHGRGRLRVLADPPQGEEDEGDRLQGLQVAEDLQAAPGQVPLPGPRRRRRRRRPDSGAPQVQDRPRSHSLMRIGAEASAVVGNTPMVLLDRLSEGLPGDVCAKLEYFSPGGSVKDRIGVAMIDAAEADGQIRPGRSVVVEPTSGNTGIALAMVCAARGYELILSLPE